MYNTGDRVRWYLITNIGGKINFNRRTGIIIEVLDNKAVVFDEVARKKSTVSFERLKREGI